MNKACIESIKILNGKILHIEYHQRRYEYTLKNYYGVLSNSKLKKLINPPKYGLYKCKIIYKENRILDITYIKYIKKSFLKLKIIEDKDITYAYKFNERTKLNKLFEKRKDADDVLIVKNGYIKDTSIANIALKKNNLWYTPKNTLLNGVTRQRYIDSGKLIQKEISIKDITNYSKIALLNAMIDFDIIPKDNIKDIIC